MNGRVVANHDQFNTLEAHLSVGLGPAAIVARGHPDDPVKGPVDRETLVGFLEVAALEMLEWAPGLIVVVPRDVDLSIFGDDASVSLDEDRGVEPFTLGGEFGVSERETNAEPLGVIKERLCLCARHFGFVVVVVFRDVFSEPTGEERCERKLWKDNELNPVGCRFGEERSKSFDD